MWKMLVVLGLLGKLVVKQSLYAYPPYKHEHTIQLRQHDAQLEKIIISPDGRFLSVLLTCTQMATPVSVIMTWQMKITPSEKEFLLISQISAEHITALNYTADSKRLITGNQVGAVALWDPESGKKTLEFAHSGSILDTTSHVVRQIIVPLNGSNKFLTVHGLRQSYVYEWNPDIPSSYKLPLPLAGKNLWALNYAEDPNFLVYSTVGQSFEANYLGLSHEAPNIVNLSIKAMAMFEKSNLMVACDHTGLTQLLSLPLLIPVDDRYTKYLGVAEALATHDESILIHVNEGPTIKPYITVWNFLTGEFQQFDAEEEDPFTFPASNRQIKAAFSKNAEYMATASKYGKSSQAIKIWRWDNTEQEQPAWEQPKVHSLLQPLLPREPVPTRDEDLCCSHCFVQ